MRNQERDTVIIYNGSFLDSERASVDAFLGSLFQRVPNCPVCYSLNALVYKDGVPLSNVVHMDIRCDCRHLISIRNLRFNYRPYNPTVQAGVRIRAERPAAAGAARG